MRVSEARVSCSAASYCLGGQSQEAKGIDERGHRCPVANRQRRFSCTLTLGRSRARLSSPFDALPADDPFVRNAIDFSSWQGLLSTLLGLALFSLIVVGVRLLVMQTLQLRRERENRQINERLRTLIAAYKVLGGSFTGNLTVDPTHLRDLRMKAGHDASDVEDVTAMEAGSAAAGGPNATTSFERRRRVRDAVEAALSDVILLGTEEQVRLAVAAANDMVAGRAIETAELVVSLRTFIREVLDLDPVAADLALPKQGPTRPGGSASRGGRDERANGRSGAGRPKIGQAAGGGIAGYGAIGGDGSEEKPHGD